MSEPSGTPGEPGPDWRQMRREERQQRRDVRWQGGPWIGGVILIVLGAIFLLRNYGFPVPENWWAVFLFLPAAAALTTAWSIYQRDGRMTSGAIGAAIGGLVLAVLGISFLAGFDWSRLWPVILIALGIGVLVGGFRRR